MSDDYSFVVTFVDYLFKLDIYLYISLYIQAEYRRFGVFIFIVLFPVPVISFFIVACCFITAAGGRGDFCLFPPDGMHIIYNYGFHSLLIIILLSQPL